MKGVWIPYSSEEIAWLAEHHQLPISDYHAAFNARFERTDVSRQNLNALRKRKGWKTGRTGRYEKGQTPWSKGKTCEPGKGGRHPNARKTQFKKGGLPHNTQYLGHERVSKDGYVEISVDEVNPHTGYERRYVLKHRYLWEQKNGPVPDDMFLKCLDTDKTNTDPSNWQLLPRATLPYLNGHRGFDYAAVEPEVRPTVIAIARLRHAAKKTRRRERTL